MRIEWTVDASEELERIYNNIYHFTFSEYIATNWYNIILEESVRLESFPEIGKVEPLLDNRNEIFRSLVVCEHYKLIYLVCEDKILILDIWDARSSPVLLMERMK